MRLPRVMIAAPGSNSGKTMITCALLELLHECRNDSANAYFNGQLQGRRVSAFKCGPDFIDPMFHQEVIGVSSRNLDCFFSDEAQIKELFCLGQQEGDLSVIEGVMGLYDGLGGIRGIFLSSGKYTANTDYIGSGRKRNGEICAAIACWLSGI